MRSPPRHVAVIGAGPAGLTTALQLARGGVNVDVYEASPHVGGLSRSLTMWGHRVDIGPHRFFTTDRGVNEFWLELVGDRYSMVDRRTRVRFGDQYIDYPIVPLQAATRMGLGQAIRCIASYAWQSARWQSARWQSNVPSDDDQTTFEQWVVRRFGRRLFELFFRDYSEKLWGIRCDRLSADFAAQRIRNFSLGEAARACFQPDRRRRHKTTVDQFAYPIDGSGSVYETMAAEIRRLGGTIHLQSPIDRLFGNPERVSGIVTEQGRSQRYDHVVSTMPLPRLIDSLDGGETGFIPPTIRRAVEGLKFRSTILVYLHVRGTELFDDQWVYIQSPKLKVGRVTNYRNWVAGMGGDSATTVLSAERWCDQGDAQWCQSDSDLVEQTVAELASIQMLDPSDVRDGKVLRIAKSYPVYSVGYREPLRVVSDYLRSVDGLTAIGRSGAFKYNNQDHSLLTGMLAAENLLCGANHDLWRINSDHDRYQEPTRITRHGLESAA